MAASAACSNPHVFAHTLRFSARGFLALTKNAWVVEVPFILFHKANSVEPFLQPHEIACENETLKGMLKKAASLRQGYG